MSRSENVKSAQGCRPATPSPRKGWRALVATSLLWTCGPGTVFVAGHLCREAHPAFGEARKESASEIGRQISVPRSRSRKLMGRSSSDISRSCRSPRSDLRRPARFSVNTRRLQSSRLVDHQVHYFVSLANPAFELFAVLLEINRLPRHPRSSRSAPRWPR